MGFWEKLSSDDVCGKHHFDGDGIQIDTGVKLHPKAMFPYPNPTGDYMAYNDRAERRDHRLRDKEGAIEIYELREVRCVHDGCDETEEREVTVGYVPMSIAEKLMVEPQHVKTYLGSAWAGKTMKPAKWLAEAIEDE